MSPSLLPADLSTELSSVEYPFTQLAKESEQREFTSHASLEEALERRKQALEQDQTREQYVVFTSVSRTDADRLSDDSSRASKYCRFSWNTKNGTLIAKVIPNTGHEVAIRHFERLISYKLLAIGIDDEVDSLGSTRVTTGCWTKEADCAFAPTSANISFVMEIGL